MTNIIIFGVLISESLIYSLVVHFTMGKAIYGKKKIRFLATLFITAITYIVANGNIDNIYVKSIVVTAILAFLVSALYGVNLQISAFYTIASFHIFLLSELLVVSFYTGYVQTYMPMAEGPDGTMAAVTVTSLLNSSTLVLVVSSLVTLAVRALLSFGLIRYFGKTQIANPTSFWIIIDSLVLAAYGLTMVIYSTINAVQTVISSFYIFTILVLVLWMGIAAVSVFYNLGEKNYQERIRTQQERHLHDNDQHTREMAALHNEMNRVGHDQEGLVSSVKSSLIDMKSSINDPQRLEARIDGALDEMGVLSDEIRRLRTPTRTGILDVDRSINTLVMSAKMHGVDVDVTAGPLSDVSIEIADIQSILSNLVNNAIEACVQNPQSTEPVYLKLFQADGLIRIDVTNQYANKLIHAGVNTFVSTKTQDGHGDGLTFVERAAKKYAGELVITATEDTFIAQVSLHNLRPGG